MCKCNTVKNYGLYLSSKIQRKGYTSELEWIQGEAAN